MPRRVVVDFETAGIQPRPDYPPEPKSVALAELTSGGRVQKKRFLAWGHPTGNNTTEPQARAELAELWRQARGGEVELIFHNAKFDLDVAASRFNLAPPGWRAWHDTLFLIYLDDPRAASLALKPTAERLLGQPPEERDAVRDWLETHGVVRRKQADWGAHICDAPGDVVGPYALGDVERTGRLFHALHRRVTEERGMGAAYDRERRVLPLLLDNETRGIRVNLPALRRDVRAYERAFEMTERWVLSKLGAEGLNLDADEDLADALDRVGAVTTWTLTAKGRRSTAAKNIKIDDPALRNALAYRGKLATSLRTFMRPWLAQAERADGRIHTNWNQVRGENDRGTRTGRLSSNPNLQNLANEFKEIALPFDAPPLPNIRGYVLPDEGHTLLSRDYSQQELRALGHFEDGPLLQAYRANPRMDLHDHARALVSQMLHREFDRKPIKNMGFGLIYGMGLARLAESMGVDGETARAVKRAYLTIFPGLRSLIDDLTRRARLGQPIRTWGGREYFCEEPRYVEGRGVQTFEYKLLNVLIQGSSADCTKEAMARFMEHASRGRLVAQVHDQLIVSAPTDSWREVMRELRESMESVEFDVPMLSDGSRGPSWAALKAIED